MFVERVITFVVLGFFVFVADVGSWWHHDDLSQWYTNYLGWIGLVAICYIASSRMNIRRHSLHQEAWQERRKEARPAAQNPSKSGDATE